MKRQRVTIEYEVESVPGVAPDWQVSMKFVDRARRPMAGITVLSYTVEAVEDGAS